MASKSRRCTVGQSTAEPSTVEQSTVGPSTVGRSTGKQSTGSDTARRRGIQNPGSTVGLVRNCIAGVAGTVGRRLKKDVSLTIITEYNTV